MVASNASNAQKLQRVRTGHSGTVEKVKKIKTHPYDYKRSTNEDKDIIKLPCNL